jgi:methionyl-tRNA formyltransferase
MLKPILFFGNERLATGVTTTAPILRRLIDAQYRIAAVVVAQDTSSKSRVSRPLEVAELANHHGIPVIAPSRLRDASVELAAFQAGAAVLVAYGKIIPKAILDLFEVGIINIHPSLLPLHRGPTPLESVLLKGDVETGVSLMKLASTMDAGPVYAQETVLLRGDESKQQLADQLATIGGDMLMAYLPSILDGSLEASEQDDTKATYDSMIDKTAGVLTSKEWNQPAQLLERQVRAFAGWPRTRTQLAGTDIRITVVHCIEGNGVPGSLWIEGTNIGVHTSDGILVIDKLIPAGRNEMTGTAFLAGYRPV